MLPAWSTLLTLCISFFACSGYALQVPSDERRLTVVYRRGDVSGLFPFPRVGRSHISSEDVFGDRSTGGGLAMSKRQGLIPFPRVGKRQPLASRALFGPSAGDSGAFYDELVQGRPAMISQEGESWGSPGAEVKRSGEAQEGMWFGPRLGRRRRSTEQGPAGKHRPNDYWPMADRGPSRDFLERGPELRIVKEDPLQPSDDEDVADDTELLYGESAAETPGEEAGRRRRRQPEEEGGAKGRRKGGPA